MGRQKNSLRLPRIALGAATPHEEYSVNDPKNHKLKIRPRRFGPPLFGDESRKGFSADSLLKSAAQKATERETLEVCAGSGRRKQL